VGQFHSNGFHSNGFDSIESCLHLNLSLYFGAPNFVSVHLHPSREVVSTTDQAAREVELHVTRDLIVELHSVPSGTGWAGQSGKSGEFGAADATWG